MISGVILYDETIRQKTRDGVPFPDYLVKLGVIPGIKVDTGANGGWPVFKARPSPRGWMACVSG